MSIVAEEWKGQLAQLSIDDRAELAAYLLDTLDQNEDAGVDAAWDDELERRESEIRNGQVNGIPADELIAGLRERWA